MARATGTVKSYFGEKGFGFIAPHDGSDDVFVHFSNIQMDGFKSLGEGEEVEYEPYYDAARGKTAAVCVTGPGGAPLYGDGSTGKGQGGGKGKGKGGGGYDQGYGGGGGGGGYNQGYGGGGGYGGGKGDGGYGGGYY